MSCSRAFFLSCWWSDDTSVILGEHWVFLRSPNGHLTELKKADSNVTFRLMVLFPCAFVPISLVFFLMVLLCLIKKSRVFELFSLCVFHGYLELQDMWLCINTKILSISNALFCIILSCQDCIENKPSSCALYSGKNSSWGGRRW